MTHNMSRRGGVIREKEIVMDKGFMNKLKAAKNEIAMSAMMTAASVGSIPVYAAESSTADANGNMSIPTVNIDSMNGNFNVMVGKALGLVFVFSKVAGAFFFIWGAYMLFNSMKSEEAESKGRAIMTLIAGAGLMSLQYICSLVGITAA